MVQYTECRSISDVSIISDIPDSENLAFRIDPSDTASLTTSDDEITQIDDLSGNNLHLDDGSLSGTADINGLQALDVEKGDQLLRNPFGLDVEHPFSLYYAAEMRSDQSPTDSRLVILGGADEGGSVWRTGTRENTDESKMNAGETVQTSHEMQNPTVRGDIFDGGNSELWINGSQEATGDAGSREQDSDEEFGIAKPAGSTPENQPAMKLGEVLLYNAKHDSETTEKVFDYLSRWLP